MAPKPVLYQMIASPPSRAVMMIIDILGIDVEMRDLNPILREQDTPELVQKNPMKTIPLFQDGDFCLADSHAIIIYLMETYGKDEHTHLYPSDKKKRATVFQRLFFDCGVLFPRLRSVMAPTYGGRLSEMTRNMVRNIEAAYAMLEVYLSQTAYMADDVPTVADFSILSTISTLDGLCPVDVTRSDVKRFPKLAKWLRNMNEMDVCKRINKPGSEEHVMGLKTLMEYTKTKSKL